MNILIIDDEAMIREWMVYTINNLNEEIDLIDTAIDGIEAFEKLNTTVFDLVFVDITMPRMDGLELIKKMNTLPDLPLIVVLTSHDQFNYAREALHHNAYEYLLKNECSKEKLLELIHVCQSQLKEKQLSMDLSYHRSSFLASVLSGESINMKLPLNTLFPELVDTSFIVVSYNRTDITNAKLHALFKENRRLFIGNFKSTAFFSYALKHNVTQKDIEIMLSNFSKDINVSIGCSKQYNDIVDLHKAIKSAYKAQQQLFYLDTTYVIDGAAPKSHIDMTEIQEHCDRILSNIKSNHLDEARDNLSILQHLITQYKPDDVEYVKNVNYNILSALLVHLSSSNQQVFPNLDVLKSRMEKSQHFSDIKSFTDEYFYFLSPIQRSLPKHCSTYILEAINYIHTRYNSIESVAQIANHVHLNADYFSRLFKKEIGAPASTYLMNYKLEMAAQLLSTTTETVYEISLQVGYSNISYFSKIFKAKYGLQPSQYRKQNSE